MKKIFHTFLSLLLTLSLIPIFPVFAQEETDVECVQSEHNVSSEYIISDENIIERTVLHLDGDVYSTESIVFSSGTMTVTTKLNGQVIDSFTLSGVNFEQHLSYAINANRPIARADCSFGNDSFTHFFIRSESATWERNEVAEWIISGVLIVYNALTMKFPNIPDAPRLTFAADVLSFVTAWGAHKETIITNTYEIWSKQTNSYYNLCFHITQMLFDTNGDSDGMTTGAYHP